MTKERRRERKKERKEINLERIKKEWKGWETAFRWIDKVLTNPTLCSLNLV